MPGILDDNAPSPGAPFIDFSALSPTEASCGRSSPASSLGGWNHDSDWDYGTRRAVAMFLVSLGVFADGLLEHA
jgi:hypothetical protein